MFSDRPLRTTESNVRSTGGPGSVSTGTQASSGKSRTISADARVPCESAKCSSETDRGSANPPKTASRGSANPHKMAPKGSAAPSKSADEHKSSAGPLKTATSKDDSSSLRCSPSQVRADGVLLDVEGFSHPRCSTPSSRPQVPPKPVASDRLKKSEQNLVLSNSGEAMEYSIIQWNLRGFQANFQELGLLSGRYKPAVFGLQETFLTSSKTPSFSGFSILTKNSPNDRATGGVALLINKSCLVKFI